MIILFATAFAAMSLASGSTGALKPTDLKFISDKPTISLDPSKSYMLVQSEGAGPLAFVRLADPAEVADYKLRRAAALDTAHGKWVKRHASWVRLMQAWPRMSYQDRPAVKPIEPVEPTDTNFDFPAIDQENMFMVGPFNRFAKSDARSTYLEMLPPGRYAFYGAVDTLSGAGQSCLCMGSVAFEVKAGEIVNIGAIRSNLAEAQRAAKEAGKPIPRSDLELPDGLTSIGWDAPNAAGVDARLPANKVTPAVLHPSPHFANFFGLLIDRVSPIPGVLAYERDKGVDLTAAAATSARQSQAR